MVAWEAVQKTVDWIEENLSGKIMMNELAEMAGLSEFYYQKLFSRLVKNPVFEYVRLRRLDKAAKMINAGDEKIIDICFDLGFENHETFTRAFKGHYGLTPEEFRKHPRQLKYFNKPDLSMQYCLVDEGVPLIAEDIVLEFNRRNLDAPRIFAGFSIQCSKNSNFDIMGELWGKFHMEKGNIKGQSDSQNVLGILQPGEKPDCFKYFAGVEVKESQQEYDQWIMPGGKYIVCSFEAENFELLVNNAIYKAGQYAANVWWKSKNLTKADFEPFQVELYFGKEPEGNQMELWWKLI